MTAILLDTHAWVWSLFQSSQLSKTASEVILSATTVYVAPCSFHEITTKHRLGKWPEVAQIIPRLPQLLRAQGGEVAPYTAEMAMRSGGMDWAHRDPFDRMIAATAMELEIPVLSKDAIFDTLTGWPGRIW